MPLPRVPYLQRDKLRLLCSAVAWLAAPALLAGGAAAAPREPLVLREQDALPGPPHADIRVQSEERGDQLAGAVQASIDFPFAEVQASLSRPQAWCEILTLHLNTRSCRLSQDQAGTRMGLGISRMLDESPDKAHSLVLHWQPVRSGADQLEVQLASASGPFGTTDYLVALRAMPQADGRTSLRLDYSCNFGTAARLAMQAYLATVGRNKVGFSSVATADGGSRLVGGLRGVMERSAMRYYLAIDAWLHASQLPPPSQLEERLGYWFDATERYPLQLHELSRQDYLEMKRRDHQRSAIGS